MISINEVVNAEGDVDPSIIQGMEDVQGTNDIQSLTNFWIKDMTIKDNKESWLAGASEVHMKSLLTTYNHVRNGNVVSIPSLRYAASDNYKGHAIKNINRGEVGYPIFNLNYPLQTGWQVDNFNTDLVVYTYVIFEYDPWPARTRTAASLIPSSNNQYSKDFLNFRSSNSPYGGEVPGYDSYVNYAIYGNVSGFGGTDPLRRLYYDGHRVSTSSIDFVTQKY